MFAQGHGPKATDLNENIVNKGMFVLTCCGTGTEYESSDSLRWLAKPSRG